MRQRSYELGEHIGNLRWYEISRKIEEVVMQQKHLYLLHVLRKRMEYPDLRRAVKQRAEEYRVQQGLNSFKTE